VALVAGVDGLGEADHAEGVEKDEEKVLKKGKDLLTCHAIHPMLMV
jgi:hypothetical protein